MNQAEFRIYIPSFNDSEAVLETVRSCAGFPTVISDNGSDAAHVEALRKLESPVCQVLFHGHNRGRVENWTFCVEHFLGGEGEGSGGANWMKWLFAGDTLAPDALSRLERAARTYPDARLIAAEYEIISAENWCWRRRELPSTRLVRPPEAMKLAVTKGNWFGAPVGQLIHRDALENGFDFGAFPWSADFHFCLEIAAKFPVLYLADGPPIGQFVMRHRRYHREHEESHQSALQDAIVRLEAARHYKQMTGDSETFEALVRQVEEFVAAQTIQRAVRSSCSQTEVREIARQLRLREMVSLLTDEVKTRLTLRSRQRKQA